MVSPQASANIHLNKSNLQWRQREFKVGGRSAEGVGLGRGQSPFPENFVFSDLEMAYFGEFRGVKFKLCNNIGGYSH